MWVEAGVYKEEEKKKWKLKEKESKKDLIDKKEKILKNKKLKEHIKAEEALSNMKDMLDNKDLDLSIDQVQMIEKVISWEDISKETVDEILEKIDEIESMDDVDKYLPKEMRITSSDYKKALTDDIFRVQIITKIDTALAMLSNQAVPDSSMWLNLFWGYMAVLDKKLIKIQENHIDIKDNLEEIEEKKNPKPKLSLWNRFIALLKEIFN